jgi:hypothetical protein
MPHFASLLTGLAGEAGRRIGDALTDHLTGDTANDSSHGQTENQTENNDSSHQTLSDVLADLIGQDAFIFKDSAFTHLLDKAGDFLDELAHHFPPLQAALTELESGSAIIADILHELLPKDTPPVAQHQDNFVL